MSGFELRTGAPMHCSQVKRSSPFVDKSGVGVKVGAPGTVGGVPQVKAYTASSRRELRSEMLGAKCNGNTNAGCLTSAEPGYTKLAAT